MPGRATPGSRSHAPGWRDSSQLLDSHCRFFSGHRSFATDERSDPESDWRPGRVGFCRKSGSGDRSLSARIASWKNVRKNQASSTVSYGVSAGRSLALEPIHIRNHSLQHVLVCSMRSPDSPVVGDVVVSFEGRRSTVRYVLQVVPGKTQLGHSNRADATANALAFARHQGVDAWSATDEGFRLLGRFRQPRPHSEHARHERV